MPVSALQRAGQAENRVSLLFRFLCWNPGSPEDKEMVRIPPSSFVPVSKHQDLTLAGPACWTLLSLKVPTWHLLGVKLGHTELCLIDASGEAGGEEGMKESVCWTC